MIYIVKYLFTCKCQSHVAHVTKCFSPFSKSDIFNEETCLVKGNLVNALATTNKATKDSNRHIFRLKVDLKSYEFKKDMLFGPVT